MKTNFLLTVFVLTLLTGAALISCEQATSGNKNNTQPTAKAEKNREIYNRLFLGKWEEKSSKKTDTRGVKIVEFRESDFLYYYKAEGASAKDRFTLDFENLFSIPEIMAAYDPIFNSIIQSSFDTTQEGYLCVYPNLPLYNAHTIYKVSFNSNGESMTFGCTRSGHDGGVDYDDSHGSKMGQQIEYKRITASPEDEDDFDTTNIAGTYSFPTGGYTHQLQFNLDGTYQYTNGVTSSVDKSGSWLINGNELTMNMDGVQYNNQSVSAVETFTVSKNGKNMTLTFKNSSVMGNVSSLVLASFSIGTKSLTLTWLSEDDMSEDSLDIVGTYSFTADGYTQELRFYLNGTYSQHPLEGTWSLNGNELTMSVDEEFLNQPQPVSMIETFTVSKNADTMTITFKNNSMGATSSLVLTSFGISTKSLTLTRI
jgi:hypothetical protein